MTAAQPIVDARPSPITGQWYPGHAVKLRQTVTQMLDRAEVTPPPGRIVGLLAPHAGLRYSGPVAAHAFKLVRDSDLPRVVVISPMHHPYAAPVLTTAHDAYRTPLGDVPVDRATLDAIGERLPVEAIRQDPEHALEIELPFLQCVLSDFTLIPLMLREQTWALAQELGETLAGVLAPLGDTLLVASSDLSHFYTHEVAEGYDAAMLDRVAAFDPGGVFEAEQKGTGFACGRGAIATMLVAARALGADAAHVVNYATSGDTSGDYSRVVGYGAAVVYQTAA
jgi:AmmeMemoRadiSam system protein B